MIKLTIEVNKEKISWEFKQDKKNISELLILKSFLENVILENVKDSEIEYLTKVELKHNNVKKKNFIS